MTMDTHKSVLRQFVESVIRFEERRTTIEKQAIDEMVDMIAETMTQVLDNNLSSTVFKFGKRKTHKARYFKKAVTCINEILEEYDNELVVEYPPNSDTGHYTLRLVSLREIPEARVYTCLSTVNNTLNKIPPSNPTFTFNFDRNNKHGD